LAIPGTPAFWPIEVHIVTRRPGPDGGATRHSHVPLWPAAVGFLAASLMSVPAAATENGLVDFPAGALTTYSGFLPPPGATEVYGYVLYYDATSFRDNTGHPFGGLSGTLFAQAPRVVHTWKPTLGPFAISFGAVVEADYAKIKQGGPRDEAVGVDLIGLEPLDLSATWGDWHFMAGPELYIPIGPYHPERLSNTTTHYFAYAPQVSVTWTPGPRWDLSINSVVEFNQRNNATGYRSGEVFQFTYGFGYRVGPASAWELGFSGYYESQLTDDTLHGAHVPTGFHLRKNGVGPKVVYWFSPATAVVLQYHHEMDVRNAFKGDLCWLEFAFPL
jgi:hypothetical protein